jgi:hypothetical protein
MISMPVAGFHLGGLVVEFVEVDLLGLFAFDHDRSLTVSLPT